MSRTPSATRCCRGKWVVCDRFLDSTRAYQGVDGWRAARALSTRSSGITLSGLLPDITFILDIPAEEGLARAAERRGSQVPDRFESQELDAA